MLRSFYRWPRDAIAGVLLDFIDMPTVIVEPADAGWALSRYAAGADLADMLHLLTAIGCERFATFDRRIAKATGLHSPIPIETLI